MGRVWRGLGLRGRITLVATGLLSIAVITGAILTVLVVRISLTHALDSAAVKTGLDVAALSEANRLPTPILATSGGVVQVQVVYSDNAVRDATPGGDFGVSMLTSRQLAEVRKGARIQVLDTRGGIKDTLRVIGVPAANGQTVLVATDADRIEQAVRIVTDATLVGCPLAIIAMALLTYWVVGQALRPVAALRHGAQEITAAGLAEQRLPVPDANDEIHRLAETLNAMLERIRASTQRQRRFVGDAAHELRSPLASLRVQLEVAGRLGPEDDWPQFVDDVLQDVERLERLVSDLLILARSDEAGGAVGHREPVAIGELVADVGGGYATARVPVTVTVDEVTVSGDASSLRRVVVNLVDNAVRHASSAVSVRVDGRPDTARPSAVVLTVADDGPGIDASERERVFDRFYRTTESRSRDTGGTGLGLPIVRDIVRSHGGTIALAANEGGGLLATITLPATPA